MARPHPSAISSRSKLQRANRSIAVKSIAVKSIAAQHIRLLWLACLTGLAWNVLTPHSASAQHAKSLHISQSAAASHPNRVQHHKQHRSGVQPTSAQLSNTAATETVSLLAPAALEYESLEPVHLTDNCAQCAAPVDICCCQPFGWLLDWSRGDLWLGTTSFTGASGFLGSPAGEPAQVAGNFGFQEGFNFGTRLPGVLSGQLGSQLGMRFTQTQLDGTNVGDDSRTQAFVTAGLFRRVDYGLQGGLVVDYLHDDWVYRTDLLQLRGELSFLLTPCHDIGFRFSDSQQTDDTQARLRGQVAPVDIRLAALDTYRFFYRTRFGASAAGVAELHAGFSEESAAILGAHLRAPLQNQVGIELDATYLMPPNESATPYTQDAWNMSIALVWSPGRCFGRDRDYYRPLFDVADNGNFLTRHVSP